MAVSYDFHPISLLLAARTRWVHRIPTPGRFSSREVTHTSRALGQPYGPWNSLLLLLRT
jgi:hypothetical protein